MLGMLDEELDVGSLVVRRMSFIGLAPLFMRVSSTGNPSVVERKLKLTCYAPVHDVGEYAINTNGKRKRG
jgi:hypothetical protein